MKENLNPSPKELKLGSPPKILGKPNISLPILIVVVGVVGICCFKTL